MSLYIYVIDPELRQMYRDHLAKRRVTDSGVDILNPEFKFSVASGFGIEMKLGIKCGAMTPTGPAPYLLLARSSTSLTPLRMSNQIGLADMGYRGELIARVDMFGTPEMAEYTVEKGRRLFQIVQHNWMPWTNVYIVDREEDLPPAPDNRGDGGFGSTGN
jgi:dUTPase